MNVWNLLLLEIFLKYYLAVLPKTSYPKNIIEERTKSCMSSRKVLLVKVFHIVTSLIYSRRYLPNLTVFSC